MTDRHPEGASEAAVSRGVSRRSLLLGGGGVGLGFVGGAAAVALARTGGGPGAAASPDPLGSGAAAAPAGDASDAGAPVSAHGRTQAGIARPATPQRNTVVLVADVGTSTRGDLRTSLASIGAAISALTDASAAMEDVLPDGAGDLSVTVGIGPRLVALIDDGLPGASVLPPFAGDTALDPRLTGGDLLLSVCGSDAAPLHAVADALLAAWAGEASVRWSQTGVRGAGSGTIVRNPLGFHDGVIVPRSDDELDASVWIDSGPAAGGTIAVVRRIRLDVSRFRAQPLAGQEAAIGRRRGDGSPLSGGGATDEVDLTAKTPEGEYVVPLRSHARAAHPSFTGSGLMLRRGYGYSNAAAPGAGADDGLLFVCFQNDLDVFVRTQHRLDESDDLMAFATTTASASFLVPPGFERGGSLGAALFAPGD